MSNRIEPQLPKHFNGLALIGEAPGKTEIEEGVPFVGKAGDLLNRTLAELGIERENCLVTNVFLERPEKNKIDQFFRVPAEDDHDFISRYGLYRNRVVRTENRSDLDRLDGELAAIKPKVVVLLGATALWRVQKIDGITKARGQWTLEPLPGINHLVGVMPTWHPSAVLRNWKEKLHEFVADLTEVAAVIRGL